MRQLINFFAITAMLAVAGCGQPTPGPQGPAGPTAPKVPPDHKDRKDQLVLPDLPGRRANPVQGRRCA